MLIRPAISPAIIPAAINSMSDRWTFSCSSRRIRRIKAPAAPAVPQLPSRHTAKNTGVILFKNVPEIMNVTDDMIRLIVASDHFSDLFGFCENPLKPVFDSFLTSTAATQSLMIVTASGVVKSLCLSHAIHAPENKASPAPKELIIWASGASNCFCSPLLDIIE